MSGTYTATITWKRGAGEAFTDGKFSRGHEWAFDGGITVPASASPHVVTKFAVAAAVDPEEALVASLSSCHMLTFLYYAAKQGLVADGYLDHAEGVMAKNAKGKYFVSQVTLKPMVTWTGPAPDRTALEALHHTAHEECFIANSVLTDVRCEPVE